MFRSKHIHRLAHPCQLYKVKCVQYHEGSSTNLFKFFMDYTTLASKESVEKTAAALTERGFKPMIIENGKNALETIKKLIPQGASVMNGASTTLEQIGFVDYLKAGEHGWNNLHAGILAEKDPQKQAELRKLSVISDYYLGSI